MTLNFSAPGHEELKPRITVFGVGGAGGNAVNNMIDNALDGVEFVVANTDAQALQQSKAQDRIQMGIKVTEGLGAGARASVGAMAAEESIEQIVDHLAGTHMCFITAGMGGGTGTGAAPIIAQAAREMGVLTVGVVTKPFQFEGAKRMRQAEEGVEALQKVVDTLIIIPNQNLFRLATEKTTFTEAFTLADDVLYQGVKGVTDLMVRPGLINLDFADVRAVMDEMGKAMMGTGEATGEDRAIQAAEKAIANPLLDEISLEGAKGVLINITGGDDLTLFELDEAANKIREKVDPDANIIVGSTLDNNLQGAMRVSVVATGIEASARREETPTPRRNVEAVAKPEPKAESVEEATPISAAVARARSQGEHSTPPRPSVVSAREEEAPESGGFDPMRAGQEEAPAPRSIRAEAPAQEEMPRPAYQPRAEEAAAPAAPARPEFAAPTAASGGVRPSPEAIERLRAVVNQRQEPVHRAEAPAERVAEEKPRFGINSLINKMTGHAEAEPAHQAVRQQPSFGHYDDDDVEQDRVEIPAFLRRQAN